MSVIEASRGGRKQWNLGKLNLEALSERRRLSQLEGFLNTSREAINKDFDISLLGPLDPKAREKLPPLPLPLGRPVRC